jgi:putative transcriptional regulator
LLAEKLGKSYNMISSYVKNRHQQRLETLYTIAEIPDIDVKKLLVDLNKNQL